MDPKKHFLIRRPLVQAQVKEPGENLFFESRIFWVLLCASLWPIMVLTRIHTAWLLHKRRKQAQNAVAH
jgi:hypothetical protein